MLMEYTAYKNYPKSLVRKMRSIMKEENSFIFGFSECLANNFDMVFRFLYASAFILLMAGIFLNQTLNAGGYSFLAASIVVTLIFLIALMSIMIQYRRDFSNIDLSKTFLFYLKGKCFTANHILENYE